jgi:hypothetical protein
VCGKGDSSGEQTAVCSIWSAITADGNEFLLGLNGLGHFQFDEPDFAKFVTKNFVDTLGMSSHVTESAFFL